MTTSLRNDVGQRNSCGRPTKGSNSRISWAGQDGGGVQALVGYSWRWTLDLFAYLNRQLTDKDVSASSLVVGISFALELHFSEESIWPCRPAGTVDRGWMPLHIDLCAPRPVPRSRCAAARRSPHRCMSCSSIAKRPVSRLATTRWRTRLSYAALPLGFRVARRWRYVAGRLESGVRRSTWASLRRGDSAYRGSGGANRSLHLSNARLPLLFHWGPPPS